MSFVLLAAALTAATPVRDPFWPVGYEGTRHVISAEPRLPPPDSMAAEDAAPAKDAAGTVDALGEVAVARQAEEQRLAAQMAERWNVARKALSVGGSVMTRSAGGAANVTSVLINGKAYGVGDLVCVDRDGYRFVWRIGRNDADGNLRLNRVRAVNLKEIKGKNKK